jgi:N-acyl-D-aspartate/D-glutamate deacylase
MDDILIRGGQVIDGTGAPAREETDFARYMDGWPDIAVNTVMQVGHNTLRLMAMGMEK